jgi:NodT family efflux transporter outer membrane factor (OMF) lipoprotein
MWPAAFKLQRRRLREAIQRVLCLLTTGAMRGLTPLLLGLALYGCAVGPDFKRPAAPSSAYAPPPAALGEQHSEYGAEVAADWYSLFKSEAINQLVKQALAANPDLEAARHNLRAAQYELQAVAGTALPQLALDAKASRAHVNGSLLYQPDKQLQITANQFSLGLSLAYDLDVFGRLRRTIEAQAAQTSGVGRQALNVYVTLVDQVVVTAFSYAATVEQLDVTRRLVDDLQKQYDLTHLLEQSGKIVRSETLQAQTQLESTRASLPALEKQRDVYRNALFRLTGKAPQDNTVPVLTLGDFTLPAQLPVSVPSKLVQQRPDILEAEDMLHQASAEVGVAEAARLPSLNLSAQYAQQSIMTSDLFSKAGQIWSAGADITAPIFQGGTLRAREKEARERFLQVQAQYRSTVINAFIEVSNALQALQHDSDDYAAHTIALDAARANRDLARTQFERGSVNELVVLTAEQQYQNAALSQVQVDVQRFTDTAELFRALGGGWWNGADPATLPVPAPAEVRIDTPGRER